MMMRNDDDDAWAESREKEQVFMIKERSLVKLLDNYMDADHNNKRTCGKREIPLQGKERQAAITAMIP